MINRSHVWFSAFVIILFAAGVASGVALDRAMGWGHRPFVRGGQGGPGGPGPQNGMGGGRGMGPGRGDRDGGGPPTEMFVNELDEMLKLTADQKTQIAAVIDSSRPRLRTLQEEVSKKFSDEQQSVIDQISKVLTTDQAKKLADAQKDRRGGPFGFRGRGRGPRGDSKDDTGR